ncbi:MAG: tetratricopeptide repeat protein [Chloroflexi bacterium]|nr:tetratricopeptide repeat protein [Chloroflexota bacterium]OJV90193.1 MAG: hypothetical protein BGO39_02180 [Chloroflexi bacterium 54-19]
MTGNLDYTEKLLPNQLFQLYRNRANLTQLQLARLLNLKSYQAVGFWEEGRSLPKAANLKTLVEIYLHRGVFNRGEETFEARQLWASVKNLQDARLNLTTPYPVFDSLWFKRLLQQYLDSQKNAPPQLEQFKKIGGDKRDKEPANSKANQAAPINEAPQLTGALPGPANLLPRSLTPLVGRQTELEQLSKWLVETDSRLLTMSGPGGTGKTRLAIELAYTLLPDFKDGIFFVDLTTLREPDLLLFSIAKTVAPELMGANRNLFEFLKKYLRLKRILLILDNFEQIMDGAPLLEALLTETTYLKIVVTSREVLQIKGEQRFEVPPLTLPSFIHSPSPELNLNPALDYLVAPTSPEMLNDIAQVSSIAFFLQCARVIIPNFILTPGNYQQVIKICQRLDGLPLAIELASNHLKTFSVDQMVRRLDKSLEILVGPNRTSLSRQQTLRMTLDWSYDLLTQAEKELFERLSILSNGFTLTTLEKIVAGDPSLKNLLKGPPTWATLESLLNKSLVSRIEITTPVAIAGQPGNNDEDRVYRFRMLETIREYSYEKLQKGGLAEALHKSHALYFTGVAEEAVKNLSRNETEPGLIYFELEQDNLRAALDWCLATGEWSMGLRLTSALWRFWRFWGFISEGRRYLGRVLAAVPADYFPGNDKKTLASYAETLYGAGVLSIRQSDHSEAAKFFQQGLDLAQRTGDNHYKAKVLCSLGENNRRQAHYTQALENYKTSLDLYRQFSDESGIGTTFYNISALWQLKGDPEQARQYAEASLEIWQRQANKLGLTACYNILADISLTEGKYNEARYMCHQSLKIKALLGDKTGRARLFIILGYISLAEENYQESKQLFTNSLELFRFWEDKSSVANCLNGLGLVGLAQGSIEQAEACFSESLRLNQEHSDPTSTICGLVGMAGVLSQRGNFVKAVELCSGIERLMEVSGSALTALYLQKYTQTIRFLRDNCPEDDFNRAWQTSKTASPDEILTGVFLFKYSTNYSLQN